MEYSSRLFTRVADYRKSVEDRRAKLRAATADYTAPVESYFKSLRAVAGDLASASRTFASESIEVNKTLVEKMRKSGTETAQNVRVELERTGGDIKSYAKSKRSDVQARIDTGVESIRKVPGKLENSLEVVKEATGKLRANFAAAAEAAPKKKTARFAVPKKPAALLESDGASA